jgi:Mg/Co/Ni transporter MgtE
VHNYKFGMSDNTSSANIPLMVMMGTTIGLSFAAMVMSSMAASHISENCKCTDGTAHSYATYTAVTCGLSALIIAIALGLYIYRKEVLSGLNAAVKSKSS